MENGHLSIEELEEFNQQKGPAENQSHLENCPQCRELREDCEAISAKLSRLASVPIGAANGMNCPGPGVWLDVAAGTLSSEETAEYVRHAADCQSCGPKLRTATRIFAEELTPEEEKAISALPSASAEGQRKLVEKLTGLTVITPQAVQERKRSFWWPLSFSLASAAAAVAAVAFFAVPLLISRNSSAETQRLMAEAYTEDRRIEMRIPGAKHAEMKQQRGPEHESFLNLPESFRKATDVIASHLKKDPANGEWLLLQAQLELSRGNADSALDAIAKISLVPLTAEYHLTFGTALLEKAESTSNQDYYLQAVEHFTASLDQKPNDAVALFNRGLAYDKLKMPDKALQDWQSALTLETDSGWRSEISQHIETDKHRLEKSRRLEELLSPEQMQSAPEPLIDAYAEQIQDFAILTWLKEAIESPHDNLANAMLRFALIMRRRHSDPWLKDLLNLSSRADGPALGALAEALRANSGGHYSKALTEARIAAQLFRNTGNRAGELRARFEEVYAFHRFLQGTPCLAHARVLMTRLSSTRYYWLQSQVGMEKAICENFAGDLLDARNDLSLSRTIAEHEHFPVLLLRNLGLSAGIHRQQGMFAQALNEIQQGLDLYWKGDYPQSRLFQFYMVLGLYAEQKALWGMAESVERQAVMAIESEPDNIQKGTARLQLVNVLVAEKQDSLAAIEMAKADAILDTVKSDPITNTYRLTSKIELAGLQLQRGNGILALATLDSATKLLTETQGYFISLNFYRVRADINSSLGRFEEAAYDYLATIIESETFMEPMKDETTRLRWTKERDSGYRGLVRVVLKQGKTEIALRLWEWYRARSVSRSSPRMALLALPHPAAGISLANFETFLLNLPFTLPDQPHLIYATFEDGIEIWMIDGNSIHSAWVPAQRDELVESVRTFAEQCATRNSDLQVIKTQGRHLYELLLAPVMFHLDHSEFIVIDSDDNLTKLPFEALVTPNGRYLVEKYSLSYSPGYFLEAALRIPRHIDRKSSTVLIAAGQAVAGYQLESDAVLKTFSNARMLDASAETWSSILKRLQAADLAHFVAHGEPEGTGTALVLSDRPRRVIRAKDFGSKYLDRLQIAILAACTTGSGLEGGVLDSQNLVYAFLSAGVPAVIATRWNVDSVKTSELMQVFYELLERGNTVSEALRGAQKHLIETSNNPYFWAGFMLVGRIS